MPQIDQPHANLLKPEYWGGHDIFDETTFVEASHNPGLYLEAKEYKYARECLQAGVGQVALGNATEVRYGTDSEFNPGLEPGSLVVIDSESLMKWTYDDPGRVWEILRRNEGPEITRPYSTYWLNNQDGSGKPNEIGSKGIVFPEVHTKYSRLLNWGIVMETSGERVIQPFSFNATVLLSDGSVYAPRHLRGDTLYAQTLAMPVQVGEVDVRSRLALDDFSIDTLERVRSVDIVYPAPASKQPKTRRRGLGRLALPKFSTSHA